MSKSGFRCVPLLLIGALFTACDQPNEPHKSPQAAQPKQALQAQDVWNLLGPSVVRIEAKSVSGETVVGTGFICEVAGTNYIVSNRHVVSGAREVRVGVSEESLFPSSGYRIARDLDLALVDVPNNIKAPPLNKRAGEIKTGEKVFVIGFPLGLNKSISQGLVSSQITNIIQFDAPISSGNSGGPLVDADGLLLGIVTAGATSSKDEVAQNVNFAINASFLTNAAATFIKPLPTAFDAWAALIEFENKLVDGINKSQVLDVLDYLKNEADFALFQATDEWKQFQDAKPETEEKMNEKREVAADFSRMRELQTELLKRIETRAGSLDHAVRASLAFLTNQVPEFDRVPDLFLGLGDTALFRELILAKQESGVRRAWQIHSARFAEISRISVQDSKIAYQDKARQIQFLAQSLPRLKRPDLAFTALWMDCEQNEHESKSVTFHPLRPAPLCT